MKKFEDKLYKEGYKNIAGLDEVGRGCWAGPLVVAICVFNKDYLNNEIKDSKKISEDKRERIFDQISKDALIVDWVIYDAHFVDQNNPKKTSQIGMEFLINKYKDKIDFALIDAEQIKSSVETMSIIKGDTQSQSIAGASIIAKVIRDRIMKSLDKEYPNYFFSSHKGYGTKKHWEAIKNYGPIKKIHRFSYKPIKKILDNKI